MNCLSLYIFFFLACVTVFSASFSIQLLPEVNPNDEELLCTAFQSRKFSLVANLLHRGADPLTLCEGTPLVDFIFENLILNYPLETFMPVLEALFANEGSSKYLTKQSKRTGILLGQFIPLSSGRLRILSFIKDNMTIGLNELFTLSLDPVALLYHYKNQKRLANSTLPFPTALAWELFQFAEIIQNIPLDEAIEYERMYTDFRDECFERKFGNP